MNWIVRRPDTSLIVSAFVTVAVLGGCTADSGGADFEVAAVKDRAQWILPLDDYLGMGANLQSERAHAIVMTHCMAAYNIRFPQPSLEALEVNPIRNSANRRLFDVEIANQFGYGSAPFDSEALRLEQLATEAYAVAVESPEGAAAREECDQEQNDAVPRRPDGLSAAEDLAWKAYETAKVDQEVLDAIEQWRECMVPVGVAELPEWPEDMPPSELWDQWKEGPTGEDGPILDWTPPSAEEVTLAAADAKCREDSRFAEAFYGAEWEAQVALMADNEEKLERIHASIGEFERELDEVLANLE